MKKRYESVYKKFGKWGIFVKIWDTILHIIFLIGCFTKGVFNFDLSEARIMLHLLKMHLMGGAICIKRGKPNKEAMDTYFIGILTILMIVVIIISIVKEI